MTNVGKWLSRFLLAGVAVASVAGCVQQDEKKDETPAPPPPAPPPEPARASMTIDPKVAYAVVTGNNKCLQFGGGSKEDIAQAEIATCNGSPAQQFKPQAVPGGYYTMVSVNSAKCLDVSAYAMGDAARVQQYQCNGGANQSWIIADGGPGMVRLVARHSGKVLAVTGAGTADGTVVTQQSWTSAPNQQFKLKGPAAAGDGQAAKGDASGAGGAPGKKKKGSKHAEAKAAPAAAQ